jgi:hypothetical protein
MKYLPIEIACIYHLLLLCLRQVYLWGGLLYYWLFSQDYLLGGDL